MILGNQARPLMTLEWRMFSYVSEQQQTFLDNSRELREGLNFGGVRKSTWIV